MDMKIVAFLVVGLVVGAGVGYGISAMGASGSSSQVAALQSQINTLQAQITGLQSQIMSKDAQIANLTATVAQLQSQIPPVRPGEYNLIQTFSGMSQDMTTELFNVASTDIRINWTWTTSVPQYAAFSIHVYSQWSSLPMQMIMADSSTGYTYVHGLTAGYYYLDLSQANLNSWTVTVEQWVPA